jgi:hypothetical protein
VSLRDIFAPAGRVDRPSLFTRDSDAWKIRYCKLPRPDYRQGYNASESSSSGFGGSLVVSSFSVYQTRIS